MIVKSVSSEKAKITSDGRRYIFIILLIVLAVTVIGTFLGLVVLGHFSSLKSKHSAATESSPVANQPHNTNSHEPNNTPQSYKTDNTPKNGDSSSNRESLPRQMIDELVKNPKAQVVISKRISLEDIANELNQSINDIERLKAFVIYSHKASYLLAQMDQNKQRSSTIASLSKLAALLLIHKELGISEPIVPLHRGLGLYLDPLVLRNIKPLNGEAGLKFLKALRLYVLYLALEASINAEKSDQEEILGIIDDLKRYISEEYDTKK